MTLMSLEHKVSPANNAFVSFRRLINNAEDNIIQRDVVAKPRNELCASFMCLVRASSHALSSVITGRRACAPPPFPNYVSTIVTLS